MTPLLRDDDEVGMENEGGSKTDSVLGIEKGQSKQRTV